MKPEVKRFCQKVSVKFRNIPKPKDYTDVIFLETDKCIAIVPNPERFANLLRSESTMFDSYVRERDIKDAVEWIQDVILKYLQNSSDLSSYTKTKAFLKTNLRRLPASTAYTLYDTKKLDIFNKKWHIIFDKESKRHYCKLQWRLLALLWKGKISRVAILLQLF